MTENGKAFNQRFENRLSKECDRYRHDGVGQTPSSPQSPDNGHQSPRHSLTSASVSAFWGVGKLSLVK